MVGPSRKARCFTQLATSALVSLMCHWHLVLLIYCCVRHVGLKIFFKKQEDVGVHSGFYQATMQKQNQKIIANITTVLSCMMLCSGRFFIKASVCQCSPSLQSALSRCNVAVRQLCICPTFFCPVLSCGSWCFDKQNDSSTAFGLGPGSNRTGCNTFSPRRMNSRSHAVTAVIR